MMIEDVTGKLALDGIPDYMRDGAIRYINHGVKPGSFLTAVFSNDFMGMCRRADTANASSLYGYGKLLHSAPIGCHGSPERVAEWIAHRGLDGV